MSESKKRFEAIRQKMEDARKMLEEQAKGVFHEEMQTIFAAYPELMDVSWHQYTPYFNDGDTCEFSCHGSGEVFINCYGPNPEKPTIECDDEYENEYGSYVTEEKENMWQHKAAIDITDLISSLGDDMMEHIFGDHVKVIIGREKIVVEDYEHD